MPPKIEESKDDQVESHELCPASSDTPADGKKDLSIDIKEVTFKASIQSMEEKVRRVASSSLRHLKRLQY